MTDQEVMDARQSLSTLQSQRTKLVTEMHAVRKHIDEIDNTIAKCRDIIARFDRARYKENASINAGQGALKL